MLLPKGSTIFVLDCQMWTGYGVRRITLGALFVITVELVVSVIFLSLTHALEPDQKGRKTAHLLHIKNALVVKKLP